MMLANIQHKIVLVLKRLIYGQRGEPYRIAGRMLRYTPGTRPVRLRYTKSTNDNARYDALQVQLFADRLSEGDIAIDVGAHRGQYSIIMAAMCGQTGEVVAFEPDPYALETLQRNLELNPKVKRPTIEPLAVSDAPGEAVLYSRRGNSQSSLARSGIGKEAVQESEKILVSLVTLDSYLLEKGLPEPRWIKIDTEGSEIRILKGAKQLLASNAGIVCELHPYAWEELGNTLQELKDIAAAAGRHIRYLDHTADISDEVKYGTVLIEHRP